MRRTIERWQLRRAVPKRIISLQRVRPGRERRRRGERDLPRQPCRAPRRDRRRPASLGPVGHDGRASFYRCTVCLFGWYSTGVQHAVVMHKLLRRGTRRPELPQEEACRPPAV